MDKSKLARRAAIAMWAVLFTIGGMGVELALQHTTKVDLHPPKMSE